MMDQDVVDLPVTLVIKSPNQKYNDQKVSCFQNWTVEKLKAHLSDIYPSKPSSKDQRLVYSGKLLLDHFTLKDVLRKHDEYHMLHLVCASRTPPPSPKPHSNRGNKSPQGPAAAPAPHLNSTSPSPSQSSHLASSGGGAPFRAHSPYHAMHLAFTHSPMMWNPYWQPSPPTENTEAPTYTPMTLMWWQQQYVQQYYMHYQMWAASAHRSVPAQPVDAAHQSDLNPPPPQEHGEVQVNAPAGEAPNEDEENRDWLYWMYTMSRTAILISVFYFYSSFSRFILVMGAMLVLNLHQAGWFPFNLENEFHVPGDGAHHEDMEGEPHNPDLQERVEEQAVEDDDGESGEEGVEDANAAPHAGFLSSTWSFIITFFMSLIPEGQQNAAN